jgi:hypothetical protein
VSASADNGIDQIFRNLRSYPSTTTELDRTDPVEPDADVGAEGENTVVDLGRLAWLGTVLACLIAVFVLVLEGYYGYAAVTFAVALSAGINLF